MSGMIEVELKRTAIRGGASVDRRERFMAEWKLDEDALNYLWRSSSGQQSDFGCTMTLEFCDALLNALAAWKS